MSNKGLGGNGLSDKEAALLAAARRELAKPAAAPPGENKTAQVLTPAIPQVPRASTGSVAPVPLANKTIPGYAAPAGPPAKPDSATRMAMLLEAERQASEDRKRRIKRNYLILVAAVMVPAVLYALVTLFRLLAR